MPERFVTLARYQHQEQALYHKERLENAGIDAIVVSDREGEPPEPHSLPLAGGPVLLQVPERDAKAAGEVFVEDADDAMGQNPQAR